MAKILIGLDLGGTQVKAGLVSPDGELLSITARPTPHGTGAAELEQFVSEVAGELEAEARQEELIGVGLAVAGFVLDNGDIVQTPNLPALSACKFLLVLRHQFGPQVGLALDLDANAAAVAEHRLGAGRKIRRLLMLVLGTGVGGAMLLDGQPLRFTLNCVGDPGHVIVKEHGRACSAGGRGCLEAEISAGAICKKAEEAMAQLRLAVPRQLTAADVFEAFRGSLPWAIEVWDDVGTCLGRAVATLAHIFQPELVLLDGGVSKAAEAFLPAAERELARCGDDLYVRNLKLQTGQFGEYAGVIGAATMAYEAWKTKQ